MSTYGLFQTPILTTQGMITGITIDGFYKYQPAPVINMNDFFRPKYEQCKKEEYLSFSERDRIAEEKMRDRQKLEERIKPQKYEIDILKLKIANEEQQKKYAIIQLEDEKKRNMELQKKIEEEQKKFQEEQKKRLDEEKKRLDEEKEKSYLTTEKLDKFNRIMRNVALRNLEIDNFSTVSSFDIPSSVGSTIASKKKTRRGGKNKKKNIQMDTDSTVSKSSKSNSVISYPDSVISSVTNLDTISEIDFDDSASNVSTETTDSDETVTEEEEAFNRLNSESKFAKCTNCKDCNGGICSVGTVFLNNTVDDIKFMIGFNKSENAFCDFGQKLKSTGRKMEYPSERAEKTLKKLTKFEYELSGNEFIDIPIRNSEHVHRIYIIRYDNTDMPKVEKTIEINDYKIFSLNKMDENYDDYKNKKIHSIDNKECVINKRIQKFFDIFYNKNFS
jgi:hypothetical protein